MTSVLYDLPGPKARARNRLLGVLGVLILVGGVGFVGYRFWATGQFDADRWEWILYINVQVGLGNALINTLTAFGLGAALALAFGAVFAAARLSDHGVFRGPAMIVVEFFRAAPLVVLIFIFYYGLGMSQLWALVLGLTLYNGAVLAEVFRAGVLSLPKGQSEAAYAIGMRKTQVMNVVLLPQALRAMMPAIISQLVVLLKDTALGFLITYEELLDYARLIGGLGQFNRPQIPTALVVAAIYIILCLLLTWLARVLDNRQRRTKRVAVKRSDEKKAVVGAPGAAPGEPGRNIDVGD
ncbi:glutamate transport system permease protein [Actinoalloteichus hoggarensis]|uniref:Putative glutamine ABC transporter permease protein GlnP n=1 Tax=Actinoalloteichus hoggarensis TaxID=1470176 RepID=A0A221W0G8_9PSEU|nr:amino acid ABC transporter permease [Actinoalloteichus hoggarensis]ASO19254.1 putative glutamine ABC transporter permease protein GlnP [Actinoalloteichus hoggarensis]MBB5920492.1 glutamate transport system permease protein [Actinoalloteichus hoggarensis]